VGPSAENVGPRRHVFADNVGSMAACLWARGITFVGRYSYREETFRELIKRLADVILTPGPGGGGVAMPTITAIDPPDVPHAPQQQVKISGSGFTNTQSVRFGTRVAQFMVNADGQLTATTPDGLVGGGYVPLTVTTKSGSATHPVHIV